MYPGTKFANDGLVWLYYAHDDAVKSLMDIVTETFAKWNEM